MIDHYSNDVETAAALAADEALDYDDDRRRDAQMEEFDDAHPPDLRCDECGFEWWGDFTRGTLVDPPEPRRPDCPRCNS